MLAGAMIFALGLAAQPGSAVAAPLPATIQSYQPGRGDAGDFWRYFFFWKGGVTPEAARADLLECGTYAHSPVLWARIPERMPVDGGVQGPNGTEGGYGLVGAAAFSLFEGAQVRRITLANLRRCMGFKGYRRYGLSAALWRPLNAGSPDEIVSRLAAIAAGAEPTQPSIAP